MTTVASSVLEQKLSRNLGKIGLVVFALALIAGLIYAVVALASDLASVQTTSIFPYLLLFFTIDVVFLHRDHRVQCAEQDRREISFTVNRPDP